MKNLEASSVIQSEFTVTVYFPTDQLLLFVFEPLYSVHVLGEGMLDGDNIKMWPLSLWRQNPVNTRCWSSFGLMLAHRLRRWANVEPIVAFLEYVWLEPAQRLDLTGVKGQASRRHQDQSSLIQSPKITSNTRGYWNGSMNTWGYWNGTGVWQGVGVQCHYTNTTNRHTAGESKLLVLNLWEFYGFSSQITLFLSRYHCQNHATLKIFRHKLIYWKIILINININI